MNIIRNGETIRLSEIPSLNFSEFADTIAESCGTGKTLFSLSAVRGKNSDFLLLGVLGNPRKGTIEILSTIIGSAYPSLTPRVPQAHLFERELHEIHGILPEGHPWLKPVRDIGSYQFYAFEGGQSHEVAVGPVHAGVIEPGHFRFQCYGEKVEYLEIALGYQHRGIEKALPGGPGIKTIHLMETAAGDTTIGHTQAYCVNLEALAGIQVSARAEAIRGIALELERMANHIGDLGALAGDVGYLPTKSFCGRLRGDVLNLTAELCGNRFGRGIIVPGGVGFDVDEAMAERIAKKLEKIIKDIDEAVSLLWDTPSVLARFEHTGTLTKETAHKLGLTGPCARACGIEEDIRADFPFGPYKYMAIPVSIYSSGDVYARAMVRMLEYQRSGKAILDLLKALPNGALRNASPLRLAPDSLAVSLVEGWRGAICHLAITGANGKFASYKIVDPSFHNWQGLSHALRGQQISDFPLCNKSFNLSYCGFDL